MSAALLELRNTVLRAITENSISRSTGQGILENVEQIIEEYSNLSENDKITYEESMEDSLQETIKTLTIYTEKADYLPYLSFLVLLIVFCKQFFISNTLNYNYSSFYLSSFLRLQIVPNFGR